MAKTVKQTTDAKALASIGITINKTYHYTAAQAQSDNLKAAELSVSLHLL